MTRDSFLEGNTPLHSDQVPWHLQGLTRPTEANQSCSGVRRCWHRKSLLGAEAHSGLGRGLGKPRELNLIRYEQYNLLRRLHPTLQKVTSTKQIFKRETAIFQKIFYCFVYQCSGVFGCNLCLPLLHKKQHKGNQGLDVFMMGAMMNSLRSKNGQLDLFVRFLHGFCLESNERLLGGLLGQIDNSPEIIQKTINNLKEMNSNDISTDRSINIFHCRMEMNECSVNQKIQEFLKAENRSEMERSVIHCSPLAYMLQMSEEVLDEFDLEKYKTSWEG